MQHQNSTAVQHAPYRLLNITEVMALVNLARGTIYKWMKEGTFPKQAKLPGRTARWPSTAIIRWMEERCAETGER